MLEEKVRARLTQITSLRQRYQSRQYREAEKLASFTERFPNMSLAGKSLVLRLSKPVEPKSH